MIDQWLFTRNIVDNLFELVIILHSGFGGQGFGGQGFGGQIGGVHVMHSGFGGQGFGGQGFGGQIGGVHVMHYGFGGQGFGGQGFGGQIGGVILFQPFDPAWLMKGFDGLKLLKAYFCWVGPWQIPTINRMRKTRSFLLSNDWYFIDWLIYVNVAFWLNLYFGRNIPIFFDGIFLSFDKKWEICLMIKSIQLLESSSLIEDKKNNKYLSSPSKSFEHDEWMKKMPPNLTWLSENIKKPLKKPHWDVAIVNLSHLQIRTADHQNKSTLRGNVV